MSEAPKPSATLVLLRDADGSLEVLLLERSGRGEEVTPSVFPGGKVDVSDHVDAASDELAPARRAAVRETREEAGLEIAEAGLVPISRWITPPIAPKRFDTWFFAASVESAHEVRVDGAEIRHHRWLRPHDALAAHARGEIRLAPPTWVTVSWLTGYPDTRAALVDLDRQTTITFEPRICRGEGGMLALYPGDAGYADGDPERPGSRHRLSMQRGGWVYERSDD
ncbi:MAG: NUDIX hydrolase [Myxococcota bacterium]|nr:NUDIX hydrolase [Myxococcota bacterium]